MMKLTWAIAVVLLWGSNEASGVGQGNVTTYEEPRTRDLQAADVLSRRRRYIVFPSGASLQLILELLVHVPTRFRVVLGPTLQVAWPLPSDPPEGLRSRRSSPPRVSRLRHHLPHLQVDNRRRGETLTGSRVKILGDAAALLDQFGMTVGLAWQLPDDPMIYSEFKKKHKIYKRNVFKKMETFLNKPWGANGRQCILKALCESGQRTPSKKEFLTEILHKIFSVETEEHDLEENHEDKVYRKAHQSVNQNCDTLYPECHFSFFNSLQ